MTKRELMARITRLEAERCKIPSSVMDAIFVDGKNPIKVWRKHRGMTRMDLVKCAGTTDGTILSLERDTGCIRSWAVGDLLGIADALKVDIEDLIPPED